MARLGFAGPVIRAAIKNKDRGAISSEDKQMAIIVSIAWPSSSHPLGDAYPSHFQEIIGCISYGKNHRVFLQVGPGTAYWVSQAGFTC